LALNALTGSQENLETAPETVSADEGLLNAFSNIPIALPKKGELAGNEKSPETTFDTLWLA